MHRCHRCIRVRRLFVGLTVVVLSLAVFADNTHGKSEVRSADAQWSPYAIEKALPPESIATTNRYLTMRDGVRIAITVYLPAGLKEGEKLPTILRSTRYMRAYDLRWPFEKKEAPRDRQRIFLGNGYAWVQVDSRGSGASFGTWPCPWAPDEVKDFGEVCDWIVKQPWSDGKIGCCGVSYDGTTAEMTVTNVHPAIKAAVPEFSLFDSYTDVAFPGGIYLSEFCKVWSQGNALIDANAYRKTLKGMQRYAFKGVMPVDEDRDGSLLDAAIASHRWNGNVYEFCASVSFKDDMWTNAPELTFDDISPSGKIAELRQSGIPVYSYSGWYDGAYQHAAIKRFLTVRNPGSKLVIGPWSHAGTYNAGPSAQLHTDFDHTAELLRFFDFYLKGMPTYIAQEPPIHYYTMVEEKWKSCKEWPPAATNQTFYFASGNRLAAEKPASTGDADKYVADYSAGTGAHSRWNTLMGGGPVTYPDRAQEDKKLLTYSTEVLPSDVEVTGHPLVTLFIQSTAADGQFFVYLEDVDEKGSVHYVTEGELRGLCRKVSTDPQPYADLVPYHSYLRKDAETLTPGKTAELVFDILPTSYLFRRGHRIRVAIANADKDHFQPNRFAPPTVSYLRDAESPSHIDLPIVAR